MGTILVTGGAGAIGWNLTKRLLGAGNRVVVLDDLSSGHESLIESDAIFINGSICSTEALDEAFSYKPDHVFHLAAFFANQNSVDHPHTDLDINGHGLLNVLEYSQKFGVKRLLYTSSSCVYANQPNMVEHAHVMDLDTPYAVTKYLGEQYCNYWSRMYSLEIVVCRLFNSFGPGERPGKYRNVIPNFFKLAMEGHPLPITGTGDEVRDFNYVEDAIQGLLLAMESDRGAGEVFNIASGKPTRIIDVAIGINELTGNTAGVEFLERRSWDTVTCRVASIEKARELLGYNPATRFEDGLARTYEWFKTLYE